MESFFTFLGIVKIGARPDTFIFVNNIHENEYRFSMINESSIAWE